MKLGIYEFLGLAVPGVLLVCEGWIFVRGWSSFAKALSGLNAAGFSVLMIAAFVLGHFVQELGDTVVKMVRGKRFFRRERDKLWASTEAEYLKSAIWAECGVALGDVDAAFDYCLTRISDGFSKREVFIATSDLARSFLVLAACGLAPAWRLASDRASSVFSFALFLSCYLVLLLLAARLAWTRMVRFRAMSETGVFRAFIGSRPAKNL